MQASHIMSVYMCGTIKTTDSVVLTYSYLADPTERWRTPIIYV